MQPLKHRRTTPTQASSYFHKIFSKLTPTIRVYFEYVAKKRCTGVGLGCNVLTELGSEWLSAWFITSSVWSVNEPWMEKGVGVSSLVGLISIDELQIKVSYYINSHKCNAWFPVVNLQPLQSIISILMSYTAKVKSQSTTGSNAHSFWYYCFCKISKYALLYTRFFIAICLNHL